MSNYKCNCCSGRGIIGINIVTGLDRVCPVCHGHGTLGPNSSKNIQELYAGAVLAKENPNYVTNNSIRYLGVFYYRYSRYALSPLLDCSAKVPVAARVTQTLPWKEAHKHVKQFLLQFTRG